MNDLIKEIKELKKQAPKVIDIIDASPYDPKKNIGGYFTQNIFLSKLHERNNEYKERLFSLQKILNKNVSDKNIFFLFLFGHKGAGKSTFLQNFKSKFDEFDVHISNTKYYNSSKKEKTLNTISRAIKRLLLDEKNIEDKILVNVFNQLSNKIELYHQFFQKSFIDNYLLPQKSINLTIQDYKNAIRKADKDEIFILLVMVFSNQIVFNKIKSKKSIIIFDNLDSSSIQNTINTFLRKLNEINTFTRYLLWNSIEISDFVQYFKIVFCIDIDSRGIQEKFNRYMLQIPTLNFFHLAFRNRYYKDIIDKRINFSKEVCSKREFNKFKSGVSFIEYDGDISSLYPMYDITNLLDNDNFYRQLNKFRYLDRKIDYYFEEIIFIRANENLDIAIIINQEFTKFKNYNLDDFLDELWNIIIPSQNPQLIGLKAGSVLMTFKMDSKDAEKLYLAIKTGKLKRLNITDVDLVEFKNIGEIEIYKIKEILLKEIADDFENGLESLGKTIKKDSLKYKDFTQLKSSFTDAKKLFVQGLIDYTSYKIDLNKSILFSIMIIEEIVRQDLYN